jgi:hypothetical protein
MISLYHEMSGTTGSPVDRIRNQWNQYTTEREFSTGLWVYSNVLIRGVVHRGNPVGLISKGVKDKLWEERCQRDSP